MFPFVRHACRHRSRWSLRDSREHPSNRAAACSRPVYPPEYSGGWLQPPSLYRFFSFFDFSIFQIFDFSYFHFCKRYATHPRQLYIGVCKINAYSWFMKLCAVPQHPPGVTRTRRALSVFRCFSCVRHTFFINFLKKQAFFGKKRCLFLLFFVCICMMKKSYDRMMTLVRI